MSSEAASSGIMETTAFQLWTKDMEDPDWKDLVPHFRRMTPEELRPHNVAGERFCPKICFVGSEMRRRLACLRLPSQRQVLVGSLRAP